MTRYCLFSLVLLSSIGCVSAKDHHIHSFKKIHLTPHFWSEGANFGDFNKDGKTDVVSGPFWYEGPDFKTRHEYYPATEKFVVKKQDGTEETIPGIEGALGRNNAYSKNFFAFSQDFDKDGWTDILILGFPGEHSSWYENPKGKEGHWTRHVAIDVTDNESPTFEDITGDDKAEIVCSSQGYMGYATPDAANPTNKWTFHRISPNRNYHKFTHGLGIGDVNNDGRKDLLEKDGWWEQPSSLDGDPEWKWHAYPFAPGQGGSHMYAYDVNGDGRNDVITAFQAHGYGLYWYEQLADKNDKGEIQFKQQAILHKDPTPSKYGVSFSQPHAVALVDMNGDGLKDIVTGKRFWAHGSQGDPEPNAAAVLYWFKLVRNEDKTADFIPFQIDNDSGIGTQVIAADCNGDKLPDIVVGNKKGTFVHLHEAKKVSKAEWNASLPKVVEKK